MILAHRPVRVFRCFSTFLFRGIFGTFSHLVMCVAQSVSRNNSLKNHHEVKNIFISQRENRRHFHVRLASSFNVFRNGLMRWIFCESLSLFRHGI